jgi:hypothetical protein
LRSASAEPRPAWAAIWSMGCALVQQPGAHRRAGEVAEVAGEAAAAHCGALRQRIQAQHRAGVTKVAERPGQHTVQAMVGAGVGQRLFDVLRLAALAVWRHHQAACHALGHLGAMVLPQQVQAAVAKSAPGHRARKACRARAAPAGSGRKRPFGHIAPRRHDHRARVARSPAPGCLAAHRHPRPGGLHEPTTACCPPRCRPCTPDSKSSGCRTPAAACPAPTAQGHASAQALHETIGVLLQSRFAAELTTAERVELLASGSERRSGTTSWCRTGVPWRRVGVPPERWVR